MNDKPCAYCGRPLLGMRSDAKVHSGCESAYRRDPQQRASKTFWQGLWQLRRPILPTALRRRRSPDSDDS